MVVNFHPVQDDLLSLSKRHEFFAVEAFVSEATVEAFNESILPWTPWFDVRRAKVDLLQKGTYMLANEFGAIVAANVFWNATHAD